MIERLHHLEFDWTAQGGEHDRHWADLGLILGRGPSVPDERAASADPAGPAGRSVEGLPSVIGLDNLRLVSGPALRAAAAVGPGAGPLSALAFEVADFDRALQLLGRRAMPQQTDAGDLGDALGRLGFPGLQTADLDPSATAGVPVRIVGPRLPSAGAPAGQAGGPGTAAVDATPAPGRVTGVDHIVVRTADPVRATALYAGRLGLSLRLDRSEAAWGVRLLFFRCGDMIIEVAHPLKRDTPGSRPGGAGSGRIEAPMGATDQLWGITWRTDDIDAAHARLQTRGVDVSAMRTGRRPGSRVFSVRSHTGGVPTLFIGA